MSKGKSKQARINSRKKYNAKKKAESKKKREEQSKACTVEDEIELKSTKEGSKEKEDSDFSQSKFQNLKNEDLNTEDSPYFEPPASVLKEIFDEKRSNNRLNTCLTLCKEEDVESSNVFRSINKDEWPNKLETPLLIDLNDAQVQLGNEFVAVSAWIQAKGIKSPYQMKFSCKVSETLLPRSKRVWSDCTDIMRFCLLFLNVNDESTHIKWSFRCKVKGLGSPQEIEKLMSNTALYEFIINDNLAYVMNEEDSSSSEDENNEESISENEQFWPTEDSSEKTLHDDNQRILHRTFSTETFHSRIQEIDPEMMKNLHF